MLISNALTMTTTEPSAAVRIRAATDSVPDPPPRIGTWCTPTFGVFKVP
jgi:hypothetical protein